MRLVKAIGLAALFGLLSVAVTTAGIIIGAVLAVLTPVAMVFTGLWLTWFITKDFDEETPGSPGDPDDPDDPGP